ncbi:M4 family metallopeptidase, partial [[Kitasatospora] papulosa]
MTPHMNTRRAAALTAVAAMVVVGVQTGTATAGTGTGDSTASSSGATTLGVNTATQRTTALRTAQSDAPAAAEALGLGSQEKLIVRDVIKDAHGTVHTRYERTYAGLPVLGGDLVTHTAADGKSKGVDKATDARISVPSTQPKLKAAASARKVVWAGDGKPALAFETVREGVQKDGTPSRLHIITDATTGKKLHSFEAIETGTGNSQYSGQVTLSTTKGGSGFELTDGDRGGHKTYDLGQGQTGTGDLVTDADDTWGDGTGG